MSTRLKEKLLNHEVTPPPGVWDRVTTELDESGLDRQFPSTLHNLSVTPPLSAWEKIKKNLEDAGDDTRTVTGRRTIGPWLRYAAAAVVIGLIAWGAVSLFNNTATNTEIAKENNNPVQVKENDTVNIPVNNVPAQEIPVVTNTNTNTVKEEDARDIAALEAIKNTYATLSTPRNSKVKNAANFYFNSTSEYDNYPTGTTRGLNFDEYIPAPPPVDFASRYITLFTPDGHIFRMSKKLSELVCCVSGEIEDPECDDQMKKWRQKIASPSTTHSPADFMDILSLLKSLQDNNL